MASLMRRSRAPAMDASTRTSVWGCENKQTRIYIKDLSPHIPNTVIIGLVIVKQSIQSFPDKKNLGCLRHKFCFSIRDSPSDYINITVWGSELYTARLFNSFKMNDIVELCNCQISTKPGGEVDEKWSPWTPSPFQLNMSESHSVLNSCKEQDSLYTLAHIPLRPSNDYYTLTDILVNGSSLNGSLVNMLVGIKFVCTPKEMVSKSGRPLKKCEIRLMDEGCDNFVLVMWESELIEMAQSWSPGQNIIFAVDVKIGYDQYRNMITATCTSKTIITCNPDCPEAHKLYQYLQSVEPGMFVESENLQPNKSNLQLITAIYTIDEIRQMTDHQHKQEFTKPSVIEGITYALITSLDIDGGSLTCLSHKCSQCGFRVSSDSVSCCNQNCSSLRSGGFSSQLAFDLSMSLSDQTGTIHFVKVSGEPANDLLQTTPNEFVNISEEQRTVLKSAILLERYKIYFKWSMFTELRGTLRIMKALIANPAEVANH